MYTYTHFQRFYQLKGRSVIIEPRDMKTLLLLSLICLLFSCKTENPQARLLIGSWEFVESTETYRNSTYRANAAWPQYVKFNEDGTMGKNAYPFEGGWCNDAERYSYRKNELKFVYGEPKCIPIYNIPVHTDATVTELTNTSLVINWSGLVIRYQRT